MSAKKPDPKLKSGGCLCGAVRFQAQLNGLHYHVCHCERCRKWGGGPAFGAPASSVKYEEVAGPGVVQQFQPWTAAFLQAVRHAADVADEERADVGDLGWRLG